MVHPLATERTAGCATPTKSDVEAVQITRANGATLHASELGKDDLCEESTVLSKSRRRECFPSHFEPFRREIVHGRL